MRGLNFAGTESELTIGRKPCNQYASDEEARCYRDSDPLDLLDYYFVARARRNCLFICPKFFGSQYSDPEY